MNEAVKASPLPESRDAQATPLEDAQRDLIRRTLEACRWVIGGAAGAAKKLGMKRTSLHYRMKKLGITRTTRGSDN
jgi:formate hydrogenlyase transcriptional activator